MWGVLQQFQSKDSSYKEYEIPIQEGPTITFCFYPCEKRFINQSTQGYENSKHPSTYQMKYYIPFELGIDFNLTYFIKGNGEKILADGGNKLYNDTIFVSLSKYITYHYCICYAITSNYFPNGKRSEIHVSFNKSILSNELPTIKTYISSASNSYGITYDKYFDGNIFQEDFRAGVQSGVQLKTQKRINTNSKSQCTKESFYECLENRLLKYGIGKCKTLCSPISLPKGKIPVCMTLEDKKCSKEIFITIFQNITRNECPRPCESIGFSVKNNWIVNLEKSHKFRFVYEFLINEQLQVYEEYLIYDIISLVGSVGGTLGIFVGFSLKELFSNICNILQNYIMKHFK